MSSQDLGIDQMAELEPRQAFAFAVGLGIRLLTRFIDVKQRAFSQITAIGLQAQGLPVSEWFECALQRFGMREFCHAVEWIDQGIACTGTGGINPEHQTLFTTLQQIGRRLAGLLHVADHRRRIEPGLWPVCAKVFINGVE